MKKLFYSFFAVAAMLLATTSCSQEEMIQNETTTGDEVVATFNLEMEGQTASRAIGDGLTVDQLVFAVYDEGGNEITALRQNDVQVKNKGAVVNVRLVKGQSYQFVFWAQKKDGKHYDTSDLKKIKVNPTSADDNYYVLNNDESRDAFYAYQEPIKVTGSFNKNITLKRPFAQLNLGTTKEDLNWAKTAGIEVAKSSVTVEGEVYSELNTFTGYCSTPVKAELELTLNKIPDMEKELLTIKDSEDQFKIDEYYYLSTSYLLVPAKETLSKEIVFTLKGEKADGNEYDINTLTVTNAPLQRNWRTNIIGEILTGEGTFNIVIDPIFDADRNYPMDGSELDIWDGKETEPEPNAAGEYIIDEASDLIGLAKMDEDKLIGATFVLTKDLSFKNVETGKDTKPGTIQPLFETTSGDNKLAGIKFLGNNHVIRDFIVDGDNDLNSLFGCLINATVSNLTIINADVKGVENKDYRAAILAAKVVGGTFENITIKDSKLVGVQKIGGLIGYAENDNKLNIINCTVDGLNLTNHDVAEQSGSTGGLIGCINNGTTTIQNSYVKNSTFELIQNLNDATRANSEFIGTIRSSSANVEIVNCGVENNTFTNSIDWTPYHNPFVGGNYDSATLTVNGKTFQPVPTYTGETKFTELEASLDDTILESNVVKRISNATFETLVLDETKNSVVLENVVIKEKMKLEVANTILLKNVSFETAKPFQFVEDAYAAQFQFIAYPGTVKVQGTIVTKGNMEELLGITTGSNYMEGTW